MVWSDDANEFRLAVYEAVQRIPYGKVTTYGHIAHLAGHPERPRQVGICLKRLPQNPEAHFNHDNVPWQRVINSKGTISPRSQPSGVRNQAAALREEGVVVSESAGGFLVDFRDYGWFPEHLSHGLDLSEDGE